jgi:capsular polysaccharide biosynthesis protein
MNIDANVQKILFALMRRWKLLIVFALIGVLLGYVYTSHFTTLTYTSNVLYLAQAVDNEDEMGSEQNTSGGQNGTTNVRVSNTSKMNYVQNMMATYIELMSTNTFYQAVADDLNKQYGSGYSSGTIAGAISLEAIEKTAMFKVTVTTESAELSYNIAHQLESTIPRYMKDMNDGLVKANVADKAIKAAAAGSKGYPKKCALGGLAGIILAGAYVVLRTLFDVRVRSGDELTDKYNIPVLGSIPSFETKTNTIQTMTSAAKKGDEEE